MPVQVSELLKKAICNIIFYERKGKAGVKNKPQSPQKGIWSLTKGFKKENRSIPVKYTLDSNFQYYYSPHFCAVDLFLKAPPTKFLAYIICFK